MEITSRDNALIKDMSKLLSCAKTRRKSGQFVIEGARLCEDAVRSGVVVSAALCTPDAAVRYAAEWRAIAAVCKRQYTVSDAVAKHLSDTGSPQGIFCLCERPMLPALDVRADGVYVALEDVQDPGNIGTIVRTAEAFGVDGVLLSSRCCDVYSPKVLRASMGGVFRMPLCICEDFVGELAALSQRLPVLASVVDTDACPVTTVPKQGAVIVIGNEGNGMSDSAVAACTHRVTIPMAGRAESLNASMAAGILMWELCRDRTQTEDA